MASRPTVSIRSTSGGILGLLCGMPGNSDTFFFHAESSSSLPLPAVLTALIRLDVVAQVHSESFIS